MSAVDSSAAPRSASVRGIETYYRWHARIYDATRWSFLFGRNRLLNHLATLQPAPGRILEVGCGTGHNLERLARRFPDAHITGVDLSAAMLAVARPKLAPFGSRVSLLQRDYAEPIEPGGGFDLVVCSYALSMFNPGFEAAIAAARRDLAPGGRLALVDFHATRFPPFARWMALNHVRMESQLRPVLRSSFAPNVDRLCPAYGGVWQYLIFVGVRWS